MRQYHDVAASFSWTGGEWQVEVQEPVQTICHNDLLPANVIFRAGVPVALIDWEAAAPGPRAQDLGFAAWHWVPFWTDQRCESAGLPTGAAEKARRLRVLLSAYGLEPDAAFLRTAIERMGRFLEHLTQLAAAGSEWEVQLAHRGMLDELAREIDWVERHAVVLVGT